VQRFVGAKFFHNTIVYTKFESPSREPLNAPKVIGKFVLSTTFWKYVPFGVHFSLTALVAILFMLVLDGRKFNTNSRRPEYTESDGSRSYPTLYAPLQSDITITVSLAATVTRVAGRWWSGGYIWQCIFVSMERGGIFLEGLSKVVSSVPLPPWNFTRKSNQVIIFITLLATFAIDYFSAALTGSIIWESTSRSITGRIPVTGIKKGVQGTDVSGYFDYSDWQDAVIEQATASASLAWVTNQPNSANMTEPSTMFRRILTTTQYLPVNSTLNNVTVPYFVVDDFEWIRDPDPLPKQLRPLFHDFMKPSPYFSLNGIGGLIPDRKWGPPAPWTRNLGNPVVVSESRLFGFHVSQLKHPQLCPQNYSIDPGAVVNLHRALVGEYNNCFAIANVTYRAGAAICQSCKLMSSTIVQAQAPLLIIKDSFTPMALGLAPVVATYLKFSGYAVPQNYSTNRTLVIELTSRAYQAAWDALSINFGVEDETAVEIPLPALRANVVPWRVYLWVALHLLYLTLGLLFVYIQRRCDHPWVENTTMAIFWLNTSALSLDPNGQVTQVIDPWKSGAKLPRDRMLILEDAGDYGC
jgi:hypothetical protein